jgi:hypothetical protein
MWALCGHSSCMDTYRSYMCHIKHIFKILRKKKIVKKSLSQSFLHIRHKSIICCQVLRRYVIMWLVETLKYGYGDSTHVWTCPTIHECVVIVIYFYFFVNEQVSIRLCKIHSLNSAWHLNTGKILCDFTYCYLNVSHNITAHVHLCPRIQHLQITFEAEST